MRKSGRIFSTSISFISLLAVAPRLEARTHAVDALVLSVNAAEGTFVAAHRPIPGYMGAMAMSFRTAETDALVEIGAGARIKFNLQASAEGNIARGIRKVAAADPDLIRPALPAGSLVADFELTDQAGRPVRLSALRGKVVVLQFIYTRCPIAEVCPRMAAGFATLQRMIPDVTGLSLLSISLDPRYDTPDVLAEYAGKWRANKDQWHFLTGSPEAVEQVASHFGVVYWPEDGTLTHTAQTAVIGRDGRLAALVEGSSFRTDQLLELVRHHMEVK
jgi:protein SCO1